MKRSAPTQADGLAEYLYSAKCTAAESQRRQHGTVSHAFYLGERRCRPAVQWATPWRTLLQGCLLDKIHEREHVMRSGLELTRWRTRDAKIHTITGVSTQALTRHPGSKSFWAANLEL